MPFEFMTPGAGVGLVVAAALASIALLTVIAVNRRTQAKASRIIFPTVLVIGILALGIPAIPATT